MAVEITFFQSASAFRQWLEENRDRASEVWVGFYKKHTGREGITYAEAVDEALCLGWIDAVRKSLDDDRYTIRFTPRKPGSIWSRVNIRKVEELQQHGRMRPAGLAAFARRRPERSEIYAFEQADPRLDAAKEKLFKANPQAWDYFQSEAASYRRVASWWVMSAKKEETRASRLARLIEHSAQGKRLPQYARPVKKPK